MQEQELYWTREAAKERGEMPATRPSGPYFDAYLRHFLLLTHISPFWRIYESNNTLRLTQNVSARKKPWGQKRSRSGSDRMKGRVRSSSGKETDDETPPKLSPDEPALVSANRPLV